MGGAGGVAGKGFFTPTFDIFGSFFLEKLKFIIPRFSFINPLTHDNISKHRSSMKLHTQVEGQNTTQPSLELF